MGRHTSKEVWMDEQRYGLAAESMDGVGGVDEWMIDR